jgi:hypothetical protein
MGCAAVLLSASACCLSQISGVGDGGPGSTSGSSAGAASSSNGSSTGGGSSGAVGTTGSSSGTNGSTGAPLGAPDAGWGACGAGSELTSYVAHAYDYNSLYPRATADMNGDGVLDLIEIDYQLQLAKSFDIWFGLADGGFGARTTYTGDSVELVVGDQNGDGFPDVISWNDGGLMTIWLNDGSGTLSPATATVQPSSYPNWLGVAVGDLNGDGFGDIVVSDSETIDGGICGFGVCAIDKLQVFFGEDGGFAAPFWLTQASGWGLAVADLNGDGLADIVSNTTDRQRLIVLLSKGDGGFEATTYEPPITDQILVLPNGTKTPDLVLSQSGLGFAVLHNRGDGTFEAARSFAVAGGDLLAIGDFNGDCVPDIATTISNPSPTCEPGWGTSVVYGDGDGGFGNLQFLPALGGHPSGTWVLGRESGPNLIGVLDGNCQADGGLFVVYGEVPGP